MKKFTILFIIVISLSQIASAQPPKKYSAQEVKDDLEYMYDMFQKCSYDLFALNSKENMDQLYTCIYKSISDSLTKLDIYRKFVPLMSATKMSHCMINRPWSHYSNHYKKNGGTLFPVEVYFNGDKMLVDKNYSSNSSINENDEIIAINGKSTAEFLDFIYKNESGPSEYFINSRIERIGLPRLYWFLKGEKEKFQIEILKPTGKTLSLELDAILASKYEEYIDAIVVTDKNGKRSFELLNNNTALLTPGGFINLASNRDLNSSNAFDNSEFCQFIDSAFSSFKENGIEHLIIDLRDNLGGDNSFSDYMTAYFANTPFQMASKMRMKTSQHTKDIWKDLDVPEIQVMKKQMMSLANGTQFDVDIQQYKPHPKSKQFKGSVYVLINRYSYSNAAMTACIIQDFNFGKIIGEETADEVSSYGGIHRIKLPNTNIRTYYPKLFFVRPNGDPTPRGVVPNHIMLDDVHTDADEVLEYTLRLIEGR